MDRDEILELLRERIASFAASRLSWDAAEDLAQEVLIVLQEKYSHVESLADLVPLSLQIVHFKIMAARPNLPAGVSTRGFRWRISARRSPKFRH